MRERGFSDCHMLLGWNSFPGPGENWRRLRCSVPYVESEHDAHRPDALSKFVVDGKAR